MGEYINSKTARFDKSFTSCGVTEVHHLPDGNPGNTVFAIANHLYHKANPRPSAYVIFSDTVDNARGERLAEFVKKLGVAGELFETKPTVNPRTGSIIKLWVLTINHETFRKWYQEEAANRISEN